MFNDINGSSHLSVDREANVIYEHLRKCAIESPSDVIQEFRNLLLLSKKINSRVSNALETVLFSNRQQQFNTVLNNCSWIILDCWLDNRRSRSYIPQLLDTFDLVAQTYSYNRQRKQLVRSIKDYQQSELYFQIRAAIAIIKPKDFTRLDLITLLSARMSDTTGSHANNDRIDIYLPRYPYLYHNFIPKNIQTKHLVTLIERSQKKRQKEFDILLSKYIIYRFRLKQLEKMEPLSKEANKTITKVDNPSLLSYKASSAAFKQYLSKVNGYSLLEKARLFTEENKSRASYRVFKQDLYRFIAADITPINNTFKFKNRLETKLEGMFAESNDKPLNKALIVQTCRQLLSIMIINQSNSNNSLEIKELIANLGATQTTLILTKIVLICPELKVDLEKKIFSLVARYQLQKAAEVSWLIKALEHLAISLNICFGNIDTSIAKSIADEQ